MSLSMGKVTEQKAKKHSRYQEDFEHLRRVSLLNNLDYECLKLLAMLCRRMEFSIGDQLMVQGEDDGNAFLILSGKLHAVFKEGDTCRQIQQYGVGEFVGGCALLGKMPRIFTLQAVEKTTTLRLSREQFQKTLLQFPAGISRVTGNMVAGLTKWDQSLLETQHTVVNTDYRALGVSLM